MNCHYCKKDHASDIICDEMFGIHAQAIGVINQAVTPETPNTPELLPCPFCGGAPILLTVERGLCWYECVGCNARTNEDAPTQAVAREYWNRRHSTTAQRLADLVAAVNEVGLQFNDNCNGPDYRECPMCYATAQVHYRNGKEVDWVDVVHTVDCPKTLAAAEQLLEGEK